MITTNEEKNMLHPEGKILLLNGNSLDCFSKGIEPSVDYPGHIALDTTGEYLQVKSKMKAGLDRDIPTQWEDLFMKEAFFLYSRKERIYSDSRMFLTPLPFPNNLAYSGTSGLSEATLGIYLEWWDNCKRSVIRKCGTVSALTYLIAGSPLSGNNKCSVVDEAGNSHAHVFSPFAEIWSSFIRINQRYSEAKRLYQAYSFDETVAILRQE